MRMKNERLTKDDIKQIQLQANEKLKQYYKTGEIIGTHVFNILEKESKVLYYPLDDQSVWGFSEVIKGKPFVCINTSLPYDKQVFAAAHELYHLWYGSSGEITISKSGYEPALISNDEIELKANRFAAEFLINEILLLQEMSVYDIDKNELTVKDIIKLANLFMVPYRAMVKRLYELEICSKEKYSQFREYTDEQAEIWRRRLGLSVPVRKNKIGLGNLVDKAMELYEKNLITYDKLEYLLNFAELTPKDMGIIESFDDILFIDEELDAIMEE